MKSYWTSCCKLVSHSANMPSWCRKKHDTKPYGLPCSCFAYSHLHGMELRVACCNFTRWLSHPSQQQGLHGFHRSRCNRFSWNSSSLGPTTNVTGVALVIVDRPCQRTKGGSGFWHWHNCNEHCAFSVSVSVCSCLAYALAYLHLTLGVKQCDHLKCKKIF